MSNNEQQKRSEQEMAELFEVEELESRLEMCWGGCADGCCNCNGVCPGNDAACVPVNGSCPSTGGGGGGSGRNRPVL